MVIFLFFSCQKELHQDSSQIQSTEKHISLSQAIEMKKNSLKNNGISSKQNFNEISNLSIQTLNTPTNTATCYSHPRVTDFQNGTGVTTTGMNEFRGGGSALRYKFRKGRSYQIDFEIASENKYSNGNLLTNFPSIQVGIANESHLTSTCANHVNLQSLNIPFLNIQSIPGQNYYTGAPSVESLKYHGRTITLVANECYDFLWFNVLPVSGTYNHSYSISNLKVKEIGESFVLEQTGNFSNNGTASFKVKYNGFYIDHPFVWTTTGNLVISGATTGNTVNISSTSTINPEGSVIASIPGCGIFAEKIFLSCRPTSNDLTGLSAGNLSANTNYSISIPSSFNISSYDWSVSGGTIISGKNSQTLNFKTDPNPHSFTNNLSISLTFNSPCGNGAIGVSKHVNSGGGGSPLDPFD